MVQFNLLPKVKLEYVKTQRTKRLLTLISIVVSVASLAVLLLSFVTVNVVQKKSLNDLNKDIAKYSTQLKNVDDLNKILTVQNQLSTLTGLHDKKPVATRLFTYISQVTPSQAGLNKLSIDYTANTLTVGGIAPSLDVVSTYTDTLKATTYTVSGSKESKHAFTNVVLANFGRSNDGASFNISFSYDPTIFDSKSDVTLKVPQSAGSDQLGVFGGTK